MKPYYQDKWVTIYHGDCREILPQLDVKVDLVLTDPPYNAKDIGVRQMNYPLTRQLPEKEYIKWCGDWFRSVNVICPNITMTPGIRHMFNYPPAKWLICWHKPGAVCYNATGGFNIWEPILLYGNVGRYTQDYFCSTPRSFTQGPEKEHPCPKNTELWSWLIVQMPIGLILDPFLGSGTTAYCAKKLNRKCIGIEIEERYCSIAAQRCSQAVFDFSSPPTEKENGESHVLF